MKYSPESFILQSTKNTALLKKLEGVLLYGFDEKLIQILEQEVMNLFQTRVIRTTQAETQKNLSLLNPTIDMFSKNTSELVIIEGITDTFLKTLEKETINVKLLLKGDLKSKSKLVKFIEESKTWGSIAAYESHLGTAEALMTAHLGKVFPELLPLAQDALELKNQINIYKILKETDFDAHTAIPNQSIPTLALNLLEHALLNPRQLSRPIFDEIIEELSSIGFTRLLTNHALKFAFVREKIEKDNLSLEEALQSLTPPLFFKIRPTYEKITKALTFDHCQTLILYLSQAEKDLKSSNPHAIEILWGKLLILQHIINSPFLTKP